MGMTERRGFRMRLCRNGSRFNQNQNDNQSGIIGSIPEYGVADLSLSYRFKFLKLELPFVTK